MDGHERSRREFLRLAGLSALAGGAGWVLSLPGCSRGPGGTESAQSADTPRCDDDAGLPPEARAARSDTEYISYTKIAAQRCDNCEFWLAPEGDSECGGCTVLEGPIAAAGWCNLWVAAT